MESLYIARALGIANNGTHSDIGLFGTVTTSFKYAENLLITSNILLTNKNNYKEVIASYIKRLNLEDDDVSRLGVGGVHDLRSSSTKYLYNVTYNVSTVDTDPKQTERHYFFESTTKYNSSISTDVSALMLLVKAAIDTTKYDADTATFKNLTLYQQK